MKLYYDLHIHTGLSPCGSEDMSPVNIINMSLLKGLDIIAITDHNSVKNCKACIQVAKNEDIIVIPGIEVQTKEEAHVLSYFSNIDQAMKFQSIIEEYMGKEKNNPQFFGKQIIYDYNSKISKEEDKLLMTSVDLSIKSLYSIVKELDGVFIPAHVDKKSFSVISNLGFIPPDLHISTIEISRNCNIDKFLLNNRYLNKYRIIRNSDAHYLGDISERENYIEVNKREIDYVLNYLKSDKE